MSAPDCFVILAAMRTGSNLLERQVARLPRTRCLGEAFNPAFIGTPGRLSRLGWTLGERDADPLGFLARIRACRPGGLPGFRLFDGHAPAVRDRLLADPACARIWLTRDPLRSFVSLEIARATGQWLLRAEADRRRVRIRFDPVRYRRHARAMEAEAQAIAARLAAAGQDALRLDYAELSDPGLIGRLAAHLGLPPRPRGDGPGILRQNPGPLADLVENPAEMRAALGHDPDAL